MRFSSMYLPVFGQVSSVLRQQSQKLVAKQMKVQPRSGFDFSSMGRRVEVRGREAPDSYDKSDVCSLGRRCAFRFKT